MSFLLISLLILTAFHIADFLSAGDEGWNRPASPKTQESGQISPAAYAEANRQNYKRSEAVQFTDRLRTESKIL